MTALSERKTQLVFEADDSVFHRGRHLNIIIEAHPRFAKVRLKGQQHYYTVPWSAIFDRAVQREVDRLQAEKRKLKAEKKAKRNG